MIHTFFDQHIYRTPVFACISAPDANTTNPAGSSLIGNPSRKSRRYRMIYISETTVVARFFEVSGAVFFLVLFGSVCSKCTANVFF